MYSFRAKSEIQVRSDLTASLISSCLPGLLSVFSYWNVYVHRDSSREDKQILACNPGMSMS